MITFDRIAVEGFENAIRGMRNPMNSWEKSDSRFRYRDRWYDILENDYSDEEVFDHYDEFPSEIIIGQNDKKLMQSLRDAGKDHAKYRRMIIVWCDILAPLYWWKEFDTYKVGTVANSCSTMHKIAEKEFSYDDFSFEHLMNFGEVNDELPEDEQDNPCNWRWLMGKTIDGLNRARDLYLKTKDKRYWWQMIQLLPSSYNQKRTILLNYEVLANIYPARKHHKLDEWHKFCNWIETLPESWIIIGDSEDERIEKLYSTVHTGAEIKVCGEKYADEAN